MFKKILLVVESSESAIKAAESIVPFAEKIDSDIIALNVVDKRVVRHLLQVGDKSESEILVELEENGWRYLYMLEEKAKDHNVRIALQQEEGFLEGSIADMAEKFEVDLVAVGFEHESGTLQTKEKLVTGLLKYLDCPLLII